MVREDGEGRKAVAVMVECVLVGRLTCLVCFCFALLWSALLCFWSGTPASNNEKVNQGTHYALRTSSSLTAQANERQRKRILRSKLFMHACMHGMEKVLGEARQACRAWQRNTDTESLDKDSGCVCNERNQLRSFANLSEKKKSSMVAD